MPSGEQQVSGALLTFRTREGAVQCDTGGFFRAALQQRLDLRDKVAMLREAHPWWDHRTGQRVIEPKRAKPKTPV